MANATPVNFEPEIKSKAEIKAMAQAAQVTEVAPAVDPIAPVAGDAFTPERGKKGTYAALTGTQSLVRIVTH